MTSRAIHGFTLVELLVAISLLAILASLSYRALNDSERAANRALDESAQWQILARAFDRMRDDLTHPSPRPRRLRDGRFEAAWLGIATNAAASPEPVRLTITRRSLSPTAGEQRIGYRLRGDRVELLVWPAVDDNGHPPAVYSLVSGVGSLTFAFLTPSLSWVGHWPVTGSSGPPRAISIRLALTDGRNLTRVFAIPQ